MSYAPIARILPQYVDKNGAPYSGAVLKAYKAITSIPIAFALDKDGIVRVADIALNSFGYPSVSGNEVLPFLDQTYKLSLYPNQAAADDNTGAIWTIDNVELFYFNLTGQELINVGDGTLRTSGVNVGQVQDSVFTYLGTTLGAADAYEANPSVEIEDYVATQGFLLKIHATNLTTSPYLQLSGILNPETNAIIKKLSATKAEINVEINDMLAGGIYRFQRNSANTSWILLNPEKFFYNLSNSTDATISIAGKTLLISKIIISNNSLDANNDIDFSAGGFQFSDGLGRAAFPAITKRLDASWSVGSGQGGLDTGSKNSGTWYHCYAIFNPTTLVSDAIFSTNALAPTLPTGFTKYIRLGAIKTNGSSNILAFTQVGNVFTLQTSVLDVSAVNQLTVETLRLITAPLGIKAEAFGGSFVTATSAGTIIIKIYSGSVSIPTLSAFNGQLLATNGSNNAAGYWKAITNTSSQIKTNGAGSAGSSELTMFTDGWIDLAI